MIFTTSFSVLSRLHLKLKLKEKENHDSGENRGKNEIVSANDILKASFDPNDYQKGANDEMNSLEMEKYTDLNSDLDPIVIRKENNQEVVYKQNVFIRWLQPPTPPPPAPIISNHLMVDLLNHIVC